MSLVDADPLPKIFTYLQHLPALEAALGGPGRVGADKIPPYPRVRIRPEPGGNEDLETLRAVRLIRIEVLDADNPLGDDALRRILYTALDALPALRTTQPSPGQPVINHVRLSTIGQPLPEPDGRNKWFAIVEVHAHPGP